MEGAEGDARLRLERYLKHRLGWPTEGKSGGADEGAALFVGPREGEEGRSGKGG